MIRAENESTNRIEVLIDKEELDRLIHNDSIIQKKLRSGNDVEVGRCVIKREEVQLPNE